MLGCRLDLLQRFRDGGADGVLVILRESHQFRDGGFGRRADLTQAAGGGLTKRG
jgi:hypothetical protein